LFGGPRTEKKFVKWSVSRKRLRAAALGYIAYVKYTYTYKFINTYIYRHVRAYVQKQLYTATVMLSCPIIREVLISCSPDTESTKDKLHAPVHHQDWTFTYINICHNSQFSMHETNDN